MTDTPRLHIRGRGPALVMIHGLGLDHRCWEMVAPTDTFTVITYDLPGHGERPPPPPYVIGDLAQELALALTKAGIAQAHIAGLSLGGLVAQTFAASHPDRVDRLVLIDTTPSYDSTWQDIWRDRAATARAKGTAALMDGILGSWFTPGFLAAGGPTLAAVREMLAKTSGEGYARACEALAGAKAEALVATIRRPTLIVCGEEDGPQFRKAATWFAETIPGAQLRWIPGKHAAVFENPTPLTAALREFLAPA